jgi:hypothetical protein
MELALQIQELTDHLPNLPYHRLGFASSLINQFSRKGQLSPNQTPWIAKLIAIAKGDAAQPAPVTVGDFAGVVSLFKTAAVKLKWPKIRLQVDGLPVVLSLAGERSKAPGSVNVAGEGGFGDRAWYGRVSPEGTFDPSRSLTPEFAAALVPVLQELAGDPLAAVKRYGTLTGSCMFCAKPLTDERSKAAGCGETCAKNYGLHDAWKQAAK